MSEPENTPDEAALELPSFFRRKSKKAAVSDSTTPPPSVPSRESSSTDAQAPDHTSGTVSASADTALDTTKTPGAQAGSLLRPGVPQARESTPPPRRETQPPSQPAPRPQQYGDPANEGSETRHDDATATTTLDTPVEAAYDEPDTHRGFDDQEVEATSSRRAEKEPSRLADLAVGVAVPLIGAIVGVLGIGLTFVGLKGCELLTGTDSCGGPGLLVLGAILIVLTLAGATMLKLVSVASAGSVSFLGVLIFATIVLFFLSSLLFNPVFLLVGPILMAVTYLLAYWMSRAITEGYEDEPKPGTDIR